MTYPHTLIRWDADAIAGWERAAPTVADDPRARVALLGPLVAGGAAVEVIPTWAAETPAGAWIEVQLLVTRGEADRLFRVAAWDNAPADSRRGSFDAQAGPDGRMATDTVLLATPSDGLRARVLLCAEPGADMPELTALSLCLTAEGAARPPERGEADALPASSLHMPLLISQYLSYPEYGPLWCSPTSVAMLLAYWHQRTGDPRLAAFLAPESVPATVAPMVYDPGWEGTGNWAFNSAFMASLGLSAYVTRFHSLAQLARWTAAGVPVAISIRWEPGELDGALGRSPGHITVVTGFLGDRVLMAEPATRDPATIARSYRADQLFACWQRASSGVVYLAHPFGWRGPAAGPGDAWEG